jgi:hypothetical protein
VFRFEQIWLCGGYIRLLFERPLEHGAAMTRLAITLAGTVSKLIDRALTQEVQQAQISLVGADYLYDEIRIPNTQNWEVGNGIEITIRPI